MTEDESTFVENDYPKVIALSMVAAREFRAGALDANHEPGHRKWLAHLADLQARWAREMNHRMLRERRQTSRQMRLTL